VTGSIEKRYMHTAVAYEDFMFVFGGLDEKKQPTNALNVFHYGKEKEQEKEEKKGRC
jgi:hypothetical protein